MMAMHSCQYGSWPRVYDRNLPGIVTVMVWSAKAKPRSAVEDTRIELFILMMIS
jgi:hypothetical protein